MATHVNHGRDFRVITVSLNSSSDTAVVINDKYVTTAFIQCRTSVDMELRKEQGDSEYFTIKSDTVFELEMQPRENAPFYLRSASSTPTAEILLIRE